MNILRHLDRRSFQVSCRTNTSLYNTQKTTISVNTRQLEIEKLIGIQMKMGIIKMLSYKIYWLQNMRYPPVGDTMPLKRYVKLRSSLHFVDNNSHQAGVLVFLPNFLPTKVGWNPAHHVMPGGTLARAYWYLAGAVTARVVSQKYFAHDATFVLEWEQGRIGFWNTTNPENILMTSIYRDI